MNRLPPSPPPPPPPPPISLPPHISMMHERPTHASLRATYLNAFNQIFDNSINVNCICKTTTISPTNSKNSMKKLNMNVSSSPGYHQSNTHDDFMSSEDENGVSEDSIIQNLTNNLNNTNNSVTNFLDEVEKKLIELELLPLDDPTISKMQCDCSCFENLRCVYNVLKSCFRNSANNLNECIANFEKKWSSFKFLSSDPSRCCDYYGTTIFHYAASDNSYELLKCILQKCMNGVACLDSKGMSPLMRASQRNNLKCIEYLLNETNSDLNGSSRSTYTPLWFAVSNGYNELAKLLLDFNTNPSIVDKSEATCRATDNDDLFTADEPNSRRETLRGTSIYLFSPLRASIVYSKFSIMVYLLQYGANVYELFGSISASLTGSDLGHANFNQLINEDYVNSLKFFHRQFGSRSPELEKYFSYLNDFIENKNVYRRMLIEFVKNIYTKIKMNMSLAARIDRYLATFGKHSLSQVIEATIRIEHEQTTVLFTDYLELVNDFVSQIDLFINTELIAVTDETQLINNRRDFNDFFQIVTQKPNYLRNVFDYALFLVEKYFRPVSLKEACRFKIRKIFLNNIGSSLVKYNSHFLKINHQEAILGSFGLPTHLINYVLHRNC